MPHRAIFRNRIIIAILFHPVARCPATRLAGRVEIFHDFEFGSKNCFNRLAICCMQGDWKIEQQEEKQS
jgi:hypothetical protein